MSLDRVVTAVTSAITGAVKSSFLLQEMNVKINRKILRLVYVSLGFLLVI